MKVKKIDLSVVIKKITTLGGYVLLKNSEESDLETLTPEMAKELQVLTPLHKDEEGGKLELISIKEIDLKESDQTGISYGEIDFYVQLESEMLKSILLLKLYSEGFSTLETID